MKQKATIQDAIQYVIDMTTAGIRLKNQGVMTRSSMEQGFNDILSVLYMLIRIDAITLDGFNALYAEAEKVK